MENLESRGILQFHFPGQESPEIEVWVMESHGKAIYFLRIKRAKNKTKQNKTKVEKITDNSENQFKFHYYHKIYLAPILCVIMWQNILNNRLF